MEQRKERVRVETDALEYEAERIATSDIRKLVKNGMLLKLEDIPDELAPAISSVELVTRNIGHGEVEHIAKIKFWDKNSAIALLLKVRGIGHLNDRNVNLKGDMTVTAAKQACYAEADAMTVEQLREVTAVYEEANAEVAAKVAKVLGTGAPE